MMGAMASHAPATGKVAQSEGVKSKANLDTEVVKLTGDPLDQTRAVDHAGTMLLWALGLVWLLDAALQFQPYMFTSSFVTDIIEPAAAGNPSFLAGSITWAAHLMGQHIAIYNAIFATTQLLIAVGLFLPRAASSLSVAL